MRVLTSFESEDSFEDFDTSTRHAADRPDMDWGVVSTTSSVAHGQTSPGLSDTESIGDGILILDGFDSVSSRHENHSSDLSVPGTDSLPSDLESLTAGNIEPGVDDIEEAWVLSKRLAFHLGLATFFSFVFLSGLFIRQNFLYRSAMKQLGEEIQRLEMAREQTSQPLWADEKETSSESTFYTILDNCWIKAKMNVKFGDCSQYSHGLCDEFFAKASQRVGAWFDETFLSSNRHEKAERKSYDESSSFHDASESLERFTSTIADGMASASKVVSEQLLTLILAVVGAQDAADGLDFASEALSDAFDSAGGTAVSEPYDSFAGGIKYLSEALIPAMQPTHNATVTMEGLRSVVKAISLASIGWSKVLIQTGETLYIKAVEFVDDPVSYFEFKREVPSKVEL